jgi:hypothetical protein
MYTSRRSKFEFLVYTVIGCSVVSIVGLIGNLIPFLVLFQQPFYAILLSFLLSVFVIAISYFAYLKGYFQSRIWLQFGLVFFVITFFVCVGTLASISLSDIDNYYSNNQTMVERIPQQISTDNNRENIKQLKDKAEKIIEKFK